MNHRIALFAVLGVALFAQSFAHGQRETERYIPIGQSPGMSGKTHIGTVDTVDARARSFVVVTPKGRYEVSVSDRTRIWLDRSRQKQTALTGAFKDVQAGRRVEVKYEGAAGAKRADWIKVEVADGASPTPP
jgi:hypothetical protein